MPCWGGLEPPVPEERAYHQASTGKCYLPREEHIELHSSACCLRACAGEGWQIRTVGGAIRGTASHDADFVVSHPTQCALTSSLGSLPHAR